MLWTFYHMQVYSEQMPDLSQGTKLSVRENQEYSFVSSRFLSMFGWSFNLTYNYSTRFGLFGLGFLSQFMQKPRQAHQDWQFGFFVILRVHLVRNFYFAVILIFTYGLIMILIRLVVQLLGSPNWFLHLSWTLSYHYKKMTELQPNFQLPNRQL